MQREEPTSDGPHDRRGGARDRIARHAAWLQGSGKPALTSLALLLGVAAVIVLLAARTPVPMVLIAMLWLFVHRVRKRAVTSPAPDRAPAPDLAWREARRRFAALRGEYAAYECDPMAVLRLPALSDVSVPSTARFVDAFAEAQALETDTAPPAAHAATFVAAVERAARAWQAARDAAERVRLSHIPPDDRVAVERAIKLLTTARESDNDAERRAAYARARSELDRLDRRGVVRMPRTARAALEADGRGQLPA